jgi:hypothetical protein
LSVRRPTITSKKAQIEDRFDDLVAQERDGRNTDTRNTDASAERRWIVKPKPMDVSPLIDRDDQLATEIGIQSPLAIQHQGDPPRQGDRWLQGYYGNAYTGEEGATAVAVQGRQHHGRQPGRSGRCRHHAQQADRHAA